VLVSPDHAAVAIKSPTEARCSQNACADWAEEALPHCQMERAYWRSALGAPSISALDALPAHLSIRHAIRRGVVSGRANHQALTGEASARARVAMADRQPTTRRASTPQRRRRGSESARRARRARRCHARRHVPQLRRCGGAGRPCTATPRHAYSAPLVAPGPDRHRARLHGAVTLPPGRLGGHPTTMLCPSSPQPQQNCQNPHASDTAPPAATTVARSQSREPLNKIVWSPARDWTATAPACRGMRWHCSVCCQKRFLRAELAVISACSSNLSEPVLREGYPSHVQ
jgi:hypothetical protein